MSKYKKFFILVIVFTILFSSCSSNQRSYNNANNNIYSKSDDENSGISGIIVTDDTITTESTTDISITPITTNPFIATFENPSQHIERTYTAPETGNYRFDFSFDNANATVIVDIEDENKSPISSSKYVDNNEGFNVTLEKDIKYFITFKTTNECTTFTMKIGIPHSIVTLSSEPYHDKITFDGQENIYKFVAPRDGIYRFDIIPEYITFKYKVIITSPDKSEKYEYLEGNDGITITLEANKCYSISIIQMNEFAEYDINIGVPDGIKTAPKKRITGTLEYIDNVDTYTLTVSSSGKYKFDFDISDVNKCYKFQILDKKNKVIFSDWSITQKTHFIELEKNMTYELRVIQQNGLCNYQIDYSRYYEDT